MTRALSWLVLAALASASASRPAGAQSAFSVITAGSGAPRYDTARAEASTVVQRNGRYYVVDMGNGAQDRLAQLGVAYNQIGALLVTHHHRDHDEELIPLLLHLYLQRKQVTVVGPAHTQEMATFARQFYQDDLAYRIVEMGKTAADIGEPVVREVSGGEAFDLDGMHVRTAHVNHTIYTVAYRFDAGSQSIVITGDLTYSPSLVELARGADVLVSDAASQAGGRASGAGGRAGRVSGAASANRAGRAMGRGGQAHATLQDVAQMAKEAGVKCLVITHIGVGTVTDAQMLSTIAQTYSGRAVIARDLLEIFPSCETKSHRA